MLKIDKTGVSTSKRVYFRMFLPSLASVMAARPCFCSFLLFVVEVPANFVETAKRAITVLSATSNIELEFWTKFLNMSKLQNRLILLYQSLPLHHSPGFMHDVPVMQRGWHWIHRHIMSAIHGGLKLVMLQRSSGTVIFCWLGNHEVLLLAIQRTCIVQKLLKQS